MRVPASLVRRIRRVAVHLGMDPGDYLAARFAAELDRDERKMVEDIKQEGKASKPAG